MLVLYFSSTSRSSQVKTLMLHLRLLFGFYIYLAIHHSAFPLIEGQSRQSIYIYHLHSHTSLPLDLQWRKHQSSPHHTEQNQCSVQTRSFCNRAQQQTLVYSCSIIIDLSSSPTPELIIADGNRYMGSLVEDIQAVTFMHSQQLTIHILSYKSLAPLTSLFYLMLFSHYPSILFVVFPFVQYRGVKLTACELHMTRLMFFVACNLLR